METFDATFIIVNIFDSNIIDMKLAYIVLSP